MHGLAYKISKIFMGKAVPFVVPQCWTEIGAHVCVIGNLATKHASDRDSLACMET